MPANAKFARKNAPQHFRKVFNDFAPNAIKTIAERNTVFIARFNMKVMLSTKIISEKIPPAQAESKNLVGLKLQPVIAAVALRSR